MKDLSKKSITQLQDASKNVLGKNQMNLIKGGGDGKDSADYIGIVDMIDG